MPRKPPLRRSPAALKMTSQEKAVRKNPPVKPNPYGATRRVQKATPKAPSVPGSATGLTTNEWARRRNAQNSPITANWPKRK